MSERASDTEQTPPWERGLDWYKARVDELERDVAHYSGRERYAMKALADALEMPRPGLRDHFAGHALASMDWIGRGTAEAAGFAFEMADAMLAERENSARGAVLAVELADAMVAVEEFEANGEETAPAELAEARHRVTRAFADVLAEWRRR